MRSLSLSGCILVAACLSGCAADQSERPLTAEEKQQLIRAAETKQLQRDLDTSRCGTSSKGAQVHARMGGFAGADGFDARNCPRQGGVFPPK